MPPPWTDGPRELLQHAVDHLAQGGDFDRRIAMVSIDNAVELTVKTYLGLPKRARSGSGPGRKELEDASESFPALLDLLEKYAANRIVGLSLDDIEWYHRIRNQLYHSGNGITVEKSKVETYLELATSLFQSLFDCMPELSHTGAVEPRPESSLIFGSNSDVAYGVDFQRRRVQPITGSATSSNKSPPKQKPFTHWLPSLEMKSSMGSVSSA